MNHHVEKFLSEVFGEVRAFEKEGIIWFIAKDICTILEIKNVSLAVNGNKTRGDKGISDKHKGIYKVNTLGGIQKLLCVSEQGLYKLIFKSKMEKAEEFQDWICEEVIPTIRKTGGFVEDAREEEFINNYFPSFSEEVKLAMVQDLRKQNEILKPKAEGFDKFLDSDKTYSFTEVSKLISTKATEEGVDIKISNQKLTELLREKSILTKDRTKKGFKNNPRKDYEDYFNVIVAHDREGNSLNKTQTRVKANGVDFIYKIVKEHILAN